MSVKQCRWVVKRHPRMDSFCFCGFPSCRKRVGFGVMSESTTNRVRCQQLLKVAWPLIINSSSFALLNFFDRLFLSWYSEASFRASLPGGILFFTFVCGFMALAGITNTFVAQLAGRKDIEGAATATAQGIFWGCSRFQSFYYWSQLGWVYCG